MILPTFETPKKIIEIDANIFKYKILVNKNEIYLVCIARKENENDLLILLDSSTHGSTFAECRRINTHGKIKELLFNETNGKPIVLYSSYNDGNKPPNKITFVMWIDK